MGQGFWNAVQRARRRRAQHVLDTVRVGEDEVDVAIRFACAEAGVAMADYAPDLDLRQKWHEVLIHAGRRLGYRTQTVQDVKEWLL